MSYMCERGINHRVFVRRTALFFAKAKRIPFQTLKGVVILYHIFEELRDRLPMPDVARFYGLEVKHSGMACCPFHADNTPSLKVYDDHYYCFGCGEHGDVTNFVSKLFGIPQYEAAKKLDYDFGLHLTDQRFTDQIHRQVNPEIEYKRWLLQAKRTLSDYLNKLYAWRHEYAPKTFTEHLHPLFVESLHQTDYMEYLYDTIQYGTEANKRELFEVNRKEIDKIAERMKQYDLASPAEKRKAI